MKLPMRFRILHLISEQDSLSALEIMDILEMEYGTEGQFKIAIIDTHLASMKAVGMIEITEAVLDVGGQIKQKYRITEYGWDRLKYLPVA
jgi:DNA-binding PadR family transcriptional regulator